MEAQKIPDEIRLIAGYAPDVPLDDPAMTSGLIWRGRNAVLTPFRRAAGWAGLSRVRKVAGPLLQVVGEKLASIGTGNVVLNWNNTVWFVGSGNVFLDDPTTPIGVASSQLQVKVGNNVYQAGMPAPLAPTIAVATDSGGAVIPGGMTAKVVATVTRVRSATGSAVAPGESPESATSELLDVKAGKVRVFFERALTDIGQDAWGLYFTKPSLGGTGRRSLLRYVLETELDSPVSASLGTAAGTGALTTFGATTAVATAARSVAIAAASSGASPPTIRGTNLFSVNGVSATVPKITGLLDGEYQLVSLQIKQTHQVSNHEANAGTLAPTITGAVTYLGGLLNDSTTIQLEVLSSSQFRWKREPDAVWTTVAISTAPTALGATGLFVKWSAASAPAESQANRYFVTPFALAVPAGWTAIKMQADSADTFVNIVFGAYVLAAEENYTWGFGASSKATISVIGLTGNHATVPVAASASVATTGTTHNIVFGAAPATSNLVIAFFASEAANAFTLVAPLTSAESVDLNTRYMDVDFANDDLLDIFPPKAEEVDAPPAATHMVTLGQYLVLLGTFDGTGITPSLPGRGELFSIASSTFLTPREPLIRADSRPQDGIILLWTRSSVQTLLEGDQDTPVIPRGLISSRGIANQNAAVVTDAGAYGFDARGGLYYLSNYRELNTEFITPVENLLKTFNPDEVCLGFDPERRALYVADGRRIIVYYEKESAWSPMLYVDDFLHFTDNQLPDVRIASAVTFEGKLFLSIGDDALGYHLYQVSRGIGTDWNIESAPRYCGYNHFEKSIREARLFANLDCHAAETEAKIKTNDLSPVGALDWHTGINAVASRGMLRGTGANGSIIADIVIPLRQVNDGIIWEFECVTGRNGAAYLWGDYDAIAGALSAGTALFGLTFSSTSVVVTKAGATQAWAPTLEAGDWLRVAYGTDGFWTVEQWRAGVVVSTLQAGALASVPASLGVKALLPTSAARLGVGTIRKANPAGGWRLYREFENTALMGSDYEAKGENYYPWQKYHHRRAVSYRVEFHGNAVGQQFHSLELYATVIPVKKTSP